MRSSRAVGRASLVLVVSLATVALPVPAEAQESLGFTVSPPLVELNGDPGTTLTRTFDVFNEAPAPQSLRTEIRNFLPAGENGDRAEFTTEPTEYPLAPFARVTPATATLGPGQSTQFTVTITLPREAAPGGHFGAVSFLPVAPRTPGAVQIDQSVTSLILVRVSGNVVERASVEDFWVEEHETPGSDLVSEPKTVFDNLPVDFAVRVRNDGNVHVKPQITVEVSNLLGAEVATVTNFGEGTTPGNVLPASGRKYVIPLEDGASAGLYRAKMTATYGDGQTLTATTSFWVLPVWLLVVAGVVLLLLLLLILRAVRKRRRRRARAPEQPVGRHMRVE